MADDLAKLRAELNFGAIDTPDFIKAIQSAYQNMPGAGVAQAGLAGGSDLLGGLLGNVYGVGKQALSGQLGNLQAGNQAYADAQKVAQSLHYNPPTQAGQDIYNAYNKVGEVTGPLPELWNTPVKFSPDDLRAFAKTGIEDVRNFPSDYANAKAGIQREYPTMGSRAAGATDTATQIAKPLAEMAYNQVMETGGIKQPFGMPDIPVANFAVKPGGGNYPTNMGSTNPLAEQGKLGRHLSESQISDPVKTFEQTLKTHYLRHDNRSYVLERDWKEFLKEYAQANTPGVGYELTPELTKQAADVFAQDFNAKLEPNEKPLLSVSDIERVAPHFNTWTMSPYQNYITRQMGTGLSTDPYLQQANQANIPLNKLFGLHEDSGDTEVAQDAANRRARFLEFQQINPSFDLNAPQNVNVGKQTATTPAGIQLEDYLDKTLYPSLATYMNKSMFPALSKIPEDALVTDFLSTDPWNQTGLPAIQDKVLRDLVANKIDPNKISALTPAVVLKQIIQDYKDEQAGKAAVQKRKDDWRAARFASLQSDVPYEDGTKMHVITPEDAKTDENLVMRDLGQNTIDLKQCVGAGCMNTSDYSGHGPYIEPHTGQKARGVDPYEKTHLKRYMDKLHKGILEIGRLIGPDGIAQATVALNLKTGHTGLTDSQKVHKIGVYLEDNNPDVGREFFQNVSQEGKSIAIARFLDKYPELQALLNKPIEKQISEMKGKDNGEIAPEYVPHMVDFLNKHANELTHVSDLSNLKDVQDLEDHYTSIGKMVDQRPHWYSPTVEEFFKKAEDEKLLPRFFTNDQFARLATDHGVDLSAEPPKKLSDWDKQTLREEVYSVLVKDPNSLYLQDNLKDHVVENLDLLFGDREPEGQIPLDVHRKLVDMLLDQNGKYRDQLISALGQLADKGPNSWTDQFTAQQTKNMLNIMAGWFDKHPMEKLPTNEDFNRAIAHHPDPFSEIQIPESPWHPLVEAAQGFEPDDNNPAWNVPEPAENWQPERPRENEINYSTRVMESYFNGTPVDFDHRTPDVRILLGSQNPDAQIGEHLHEQIVHMLLNQDNFTQEIREMINRFQRGNHFMTNAQAENILSMLINWTERYPLAE